MDSMKKMTKRLIAVLALIGAVAVIAQVIFYFIVDSKANVILADVREKASTLMFSNNVISTDIVDKNSDMKNFIDMLKSAETEFVKFDIQYSTIQNGDTTVKITNNKDLQTTAYSGMSDDKCPIKMYYLKDYTKPDDKTYITNFSDCPQRGVAVYCEITANVYIPRILDFNIVNKMVPENERDFWAVEHRMSLQKNVETASAIGIKFYKGK